MAIFYWKLTPREEVVGENIVLTINNPVSTARSFSNRIRIRVLRNTELLEISLIDEVAKRAIDVINTLLEVYSKANIEEKNQVAVKTMKFVDDRLNYFKDELNEIETEAENYLINENIIGGTERELTEQFGKLRANDLALVERGIKLDALNQVEKQLTQTPQDTFSYIPYSLNLENLNLSPLITKYNELLNQREKLLFSAQPDNPVFQPLNALIVELTQTIQGTISEARQKIEVQIAEIQKENNTLWEDIKRIPGKERGLLSIERKQKIREELYLFLLQRREENALAQATAVSNLRILEEPMRRGTVSPGSPQIYGLALILGLFLPLGIVFIQEIIDDTIKSPQQIKQLTKVPFLGAINQDRSGKRIVVNRKSRTPIAEMFRMLRTNIQFLSAGKEHKVLLVTSSMGSEGKSFICINLGVSLAISGKKVILLGMDLRKPKLSKYLVDENYEGPGITNYLAGSKTLSEIVQTSSDLPSLDFIPSGPIPPNPAELIHAPSNERTH